MAIEIGYLGPAGTFSEAALDTYLAHHPDLKKQVEKKPFESLLNLGISHLDSFILPWENSTEGSIVEALDFLIKLEEPDPLSIIGEVVLPIKQALLVKKGTQKSDIGHLYSHPQPIAQCYAYIQAHFPGAKIHKVASTAAAADYVAKANDKAIAAIGSDTLAEKNQLDILESNIQDSPHNSTRFVVISRSLSKPLPTGIDRTTLVFATQKDRPGSLVEVLNEIANRGINLTSITSRPAKTLLGDYLFLIDCEGHALESPLKETLSVIQSKTSFIKLLGSYPRWKP